MTMPTSLTLRLTALMLAALSCFSVSAQSPTHSLADTSNAVTETPDAPRSSPRFLLMGSHGRAVSSDDFHDRFQLIAFGYISCPDVCPTTMLEMQQLLAALGPRAKYIQPIFISVDPQRDTPAVLAAYTANFDPRILGMTGSETLVRWAADNFKVQYTKIREPGAAANVYTIDHTAGMFLLGPDGQLLKKFGYSTPVPDMTRQIEDWLAADGK